MKLMNNTSQSAIVGNNESLDYIIEKIQFLLKHVR